MSAEQDSVLDIGVARIALPVHDVVRFGEARWTFTVGEAASAVAGGEADALAWGEESLVTPDVDDLSVGVEENWDNACLARVPGCCGDGHCIRLSFEASFSRAAFEIGGCDVQPNRNPFRAEHCTRVGEGGDANEIDERVDRNLGDCARVGGRGVDWQGVDSARARDGVSSTNRGPPRRGAVTASTAPTMMAADSGSRRPAMRVIPSGRGVRVR
jgi:hypothetical protein